MALSGLPPGLAKKAESGKLPANNPHVKAYMAQQEAEALKKENEAQKAQIEKLQTEQKNVADVLGVINLILAAALKKKEEEAKAPATPAPATPAPAAPAPAATAPAAGQTANSGTAMLPPVRVAA